MKHLLSIETLAQADMETILADTRGPQEGTAGSMPR